VSRGFGAFADGLSAMADRYDAAEQDNVVIITAVGR